MYNIQTNMYEGWIYKIISTCTSNVYIGQTSVTIEDRWRNHLSSYRTCDQILYKGMRKYGVNTFSIYEIEKIEASSKSELQSILNQKEIYYISKYDSYYHGYNMTKGGQYIGIEGDPIVAYDKNGEVLYRTDSATEMATLTGLDIGTVIKSCKGQSVPKDNYIFRYENDPYDKYRTECIIPKSREIYCFSENGDFIKKYSHIKKAAIELDINYSSLKSALKNKRQINGYFFNYEKYFNPIFKNGNRIKVDVYSYKTKEDISTYKSIDEAEKELHLKNNSIGIKRCLDGLSEQSGGYIWRYSGDLLEKYVKPKCYSVMKPINMYTKDNIYVKTYDAQSIAGKELGIDPCGINGCLYGRQKTAKGYKFYFASDPNQPDKTKVFIK